MAEPAAPAPPAQPVEGGRRVVIALLSDRSYAAYWVANVLYWLVFGGQRFAFVLLVLELTDRAGLGGMAGFALGIPAFFVTLPAGVWADRVDRRRMVMVTNAGGAAVAGLVAVLWFAGLLDAWVALGMALAAGLAAALVQPAMVAIVPMLVPPERLMSGVALRTMGQNLAQVIGFTVAGVTIAWIGFGGSFIVQAATYIAALLAMALVRLPRNARTERAVDGDRPRMAAQAIEGLRYVLGNPMLRSLVVLSVLSGLFMIGPIFVLLPEIARTRLAVDPSWNGLLLAFVGLGMLVTSSIIAMRARLRRRGFWILLALFLSGPYMIAMAFSPWYALTAFAVFLWGVSSGVSMNLTQALVQANTPNAMMGRAMSVFMLSIIGVVPLGSLIAGAGAELLGTEGFFALSGVIVTGFATWGWLTQRELRELD